MVPRGQHSDAAELPEEDSGVEYAQIQHTHAPVLKSTMNPDRERTLRRIRARTQPTDDTSFGVSHLPATSCQGLQGNFSLTKGNKNSLSYELCVLYLIFVSFPTSNLFNYFKQNYSLFQFQG